MTTTFVEPYAEIFETDANMVGNMTPAYRSLPQGVSTLMVVWGEPQSLRIFRSSVQSASGRVEIGTIPGGSGRRFLSISGVGVKAGEAAYLSMTTLTGVEAGKRATVQVVTTPLKAAG